MPENTFLANLQQEGDSVNLDEVKDTPTEEKEEKPAESEKEEKETPTESPTETKPKEDETESPAEEKKEGEPSEPKEGEEKEKPEVFHAFHEHPRWIAREEELKELKEFRERAEPLLEKLEKPVQEETSEIPGWFVTLFGDNKDAWSQYRVHTTKEREELRSEILGEIEKEKSRALVEQKKQDEWVDLEVKKLKADGLKFDRDELLKVALDYLPTDKDGNISLKKSYDIYKAMKADKQTVQPSKSVEEKKQVADKTIKKSTATEENKDFKTSADFKGKSFADLPR